MPLFEVSGEKVNEPGDLPEMLKRQGRFLFPVINPPVPTNRDADELHLFVQGDAHSHYYKMSSPE